MGTSFSSLSASTPDQQYPRKELVYMSGVPVFVAAPQRTLLDYLALVACICRYNRTVTNRETVLNRLSHQDTAQRQQTKMPNFHERVILAYLNSCGLRGRVLF